MRGNKQLFATLSIVAVGALLCAPSSALASASTQAVTAATPQVMQASGGLTLGSVVLIALAGAVVTFGKNKFDVGGATERSEFKLGNKQAPVHSRLSGDQR